MKGTTIVVVRRNGEVVMAADGQVTMGEVTLKRTAKKIRRLHNGRVLVGFAGAVADSLALLERFGTHRWYEEGARLLLKMQRADGSWGGDVVSTSFALLFLARGVVPVVGTPDDVIETGAGIRMGK